MFALTLPILFLMKRTAGGGGEVTAH
jgi:hypothetical protein